MDDRTVVDLNVDAQTVFSWLGTHGAAGLAVQRRDEDAMRVTLRSKASPFSFGTTVVVSVLSNGEGCRAIIEARRRVSVNILADPSAAATAVAKAVKARFLDVPGCPTAKEGG